MEFWLDGDSPIQKVRTAKVMEPRRTNTNRKSNTMKLSGKETCTYN